MQKNMQTKLLEPLDAFLAHLAGRHAAKSSPAPRGGYQRTAIACLLLAAVLAVLWAVDLFSRLRAGVQIDVLLTVVTLLFAGGAALCSARCFFLLRHN